MRILTLAIKQNYLDSVLNGRMVRDIREVRPQNRAYLLSTDYEGNNTPATYDYIAYKRKGDDTLVPYLVEVLRTDIRTVKMSDGQPVRYDVNGRSVVAEEVVFSLGKIVPMFGETKMRGGAKHGKA